MVALDRVLWKFDRLMSEKNFSEAESLLLYWESELTKHDDNKNCYQVLNELVGFYRKVADIGKGKEAIDRLLTLISKMGIEEDFSAATAYINIATALSSFMSNDEAIKYFNKAKDIYEKNFDINKMATEYKTFDGSDVGKEQRYADIIKKFASLYNNMAQALLAINEPDTAIYYNTKALILNNNMKDGILDKAVTCVNMANAIEKRDGLVKGDKEINEYLQKAMNFLDNDNIENKDYYKYVCEKCMPAFEYYGYFMYVKILKERIKS